MNVYLFKLTRHLLTQPAEILRNHCNLMEGSKFEYVPLLQGDYSKSEIEELVKLLKVILPRAHLLAEPYKPPFRKSQTSRKEKEKGYQRR